jgi:hypothetical protein
MTYKIVIAHYNENTDWIDSLPKENVQLYSKGETTLQKEYEVSYLPNLGRESQTYLQYIIDHYDTLPDVVFFTQGRDDHISAKTIMNCITSLLDSDKSFSTNRLEYRLITNMYLSNDYRFYFWQGELLYAANCNFKEWFTTFINPSIDFSKPMTINFGACFGVTKEAIQSRSKEFYILLEKESSIHRNTEVGHFFERSWVYIFNCEQKTLFVNK